MATVAGRITIVIDGVLLESMPGATLKLGGTNKTPVNTDQRTTHNKEEYVNSMISCELVTIPGLDLTSLQNIDSAQGQFSADNGITYVVPNITAHNAGDWEYKTESIACEFFGGEAQPA